MSCLYRSNNRVVRRRHTDANTYGVTERVGNANGFTDGNDHSHRNALTNAYVHARRHTRAVEPRG